MIAIPRLYPRAQNRILYRDDSTDFIDAAHLQLCFHTMSGYLMGSESQWINNGYEGVRSHFGLGGLKDAVGDDGRLVQWNSLQRVAYAQNGGNPYCISVETSDGAVNGLPWSPKQLERIVELIIWFSRLCGRTYPRIANAPGEFGTITYHQQFATFNTHNHDCPGDIRRTQLLKVALPRAIQEMVSPAPVPAPVKKESHMQKIIATNGKPWAITDGMSFIPIANQTEANALKSVLEIPVVAVTAEQYEAIMTVANRDQQTVVETTGPTP